MASNRMLKNTTLSKKVDKLSTSAEVLFYRLIMVVDDRGSFFADHKVVKSSCFPLKDTLRSADVALWIEELEKAGLIVVYTEADTSYLNILNFGQRLRNKRSKFPDPPAGIISDDDDSDPRTNVSNSPQPAANGSDLSLKYEEKLEEKYEGNANTSHFPPDDSFPPRTGHQSFKLTQSLELPPRVLEAVEMNQFTHTQQKNTDFVNAHWKLFIMEAMTSNKYYPNLPEFTKHFINWMRPKFPGKTSKNESSVTTVPGELTEGQKKANRILGIE